MKEKFRMNFRLGLILAGSLAIGAAGCASGAGDTPAADVDTMIQGEEIPQGERPRQNEMTRTAADQLEEGQDIMIEAEEEGTDMAAATNAARPHFQTALQSAESAIAADSTNPLPWLQAGMAHIGLGNYMEADEALSRAEELRPVYVLEIEPRRERAWIALFNEAQPSLNTGDYEEAARIFEQADAIYEQRPEVKIVLGQIYSSLGRADESAQMFRDALDIIETQGTEGLDSATAAQWEEHASTLPLAIADVLIAAEQFEEAEDQLRMLIAENPNDVVLQRNLASVHVRLEQPDSAARIYEDLLGRSDLTGPDLYQIGVGLYNMEDYERSAQAFFQAYQATNTDRDAAEMRARSIQLMMQDFAEGVEADQATLEALEDAAAAWVELDPYSRNAYLIQAQAANRLGQQSRAQELVEAIEALPVVVQNLQIQRPGFGGGTVLGAVQNLQQPAGTDITVEVTFFGVDGQPIGTASQTLSLPEPDGTVPLRVDFESDQTVAGYSYTIEGLQP